MNDETTACIKQKLEIIAELQRQIAVMEAALEGKTILEKPRCQEQDWGVCTNPAWKWEITDYKVASEPRTIYVAQSGFGDKELYGIPYFSVDECVKSNACPPENVVPCFMGIDLASTQDFNAAVFVFKQAHGRRVSAS